MTYTITATNNGPYMAFNVTATGSLPSCSFGNIAWGASASCTRTATATSAGTLTQSMSVSATKSDPNPGNNSATATTTVTASQADLALTIADSPDPVLVDGIVTYTVTATNNGPNTATNVTASGSLPSCSFGSIISGASASCSRTATAPSVGTLTQTMSVSATEGDPVPGNNSASTSTTVNPGADLEVTMTDSPDPVKKGAKLTYSLTVRNNGPQGTSGVLLTDSLPTNIIFVKASTTIGSCQGTSTVTCSLGNLASGGSANITIVIKPRSAGTISNSASVASSVADPNGANNSATAATTVKN